MTTSGITVFGQPSQPNHGAGGRIAMDDAVFPTDYVALDLETTGFELRPVCWTLLIRIQP